MEGQQQLQCNCEDVCLRLLDSPPVDRDSVQFGHDHAGKKVIHLFRIQQSQYQGLKNPMVIVFILEFIHALLIIGSGLFTNIIFMP